MNNRRNAQVAAKKRRRITRFKAQQHGGRSKKDRIGSSNERRSQTVLAMFGSGGGNPIYTPKRTKFKGYMRAA